MKPVLFLFTLFVALAVIGCQENQPVSPLSSSIDNSIISRPAPINEPVEFSWKVWSPYKSPEQFFEVKGKIQFELRESPILVRDMYDLICYFDGEVYTEKFEEQLGWASMKSLDRFDFEMGEKEGTFVIHKSMEVQDSKLPLTINIDLMVYHDRIEVINVWLTTIEANGNR